MEALELQLSFSNWAPLKRRPIGYFSGITNKKKKLISG